MSAHWLLSDAVIDPAAPAFQPEEGAEVQFLGVVRGLEAGAIIRGIRYSAYLPMAEKMLAEICAKAAAERGEHEAFIQHRLGFVAAEQPSILIRVRTKHSAAAFDLCRWYLQEIKTHVPIWKEPVLASAGAVGGC
jgi:molybdopterin synthase catalytic subunit